MPDVVLIGPRQLRSASETFARQARGDMVWFNVCLLMLRPQELVDCLLRTTVENLRVTRIEFALNEGERARTGALTSPRSWRHVEDARSDDVEAQLSFWGEPFMLEPPAATCRGTSFMYTRIRSWSCGLSNLTVPIGSHANLARKAGGS